MGALLAAALIALATSAGVILDRRQGDAAQSGRAVLARSTERSTRQTVGRPFITLVAMLLVALINLAKGARRNEDRFATVN